MKKPFFAEAHTAKRSFANLNDAIEWVKETLAQAGYDGIEAAPNGEFYEFWAKKDGEFCYAAIIEDRSVEW